MTPPPIGQWTLVEPEKHLDETWTEECQGLACDGIRVYFSSHLTDAARTWKLGAPESAVHVFKLPSKYHDEDIEHSFYLKDLVSAEFQLDHVGQICLFGHYLYISHFNADGSQIIKLRVADGIITFDKWISLTTNDPSTMPISHSGRQGRVEFQAINPWNSCMYTCFGDGDIDELFCHDLEGHWLGKGESIQLSPAVRAVQGACFSPNGHIYISCNDPLGLNPEYAAISCHYALNGVQFDIIPVLAESKSHPIDELEGLCYAGLKRLSGQRMQIHVVLLECTQTAALDNIFLKSFSSPIPDLV
jgi:hypothetical protein